MNVTETGDVYFQGELSYKAGTWSASQRYMAQLKFESSAGDKRLELHPLQPNMKRSPLVIRLTDALGAVSGKHHTITRAKHTFQIITPRDHYQLSARSEEDKRVWLEKIDLILNHMPLDNRTHEFHVTISPTTHSDNLQLNGEYILKIAETELQLFSASGFLASKFWSPLTSVRKAHHCMLPTLSTNQQQQFRGYGLGAGLTNLAATRRLLVITMEQTAPIGEGGFAFFTESAKDIALTITHRKEMRLQARSQSTNPPTTLPPEDQEVRYVETNTVAKHGKPEPESPTSPSSSEKEHDVSPVSPEASPTRKGATGQHREQSSLRRKCARRNRVIPMSHRLEKAKSQVRLRFAEESHSDSMVTPDEPNFITNTELARQQMKFREWMRRRDEERERASTSPCTPLSPPRTVGPFRANQMRDRSSTISTPGSEEELISDMSIDGGYVTIHRQQWAQESERDSVSSTTSQGKMKGLERQRKIEVLSPAEEKAEPVFVGMRPRTNAFLGEDNLPSSPSSRDLPTVSLPARWERQHCSAGRQQSLDSAPVMNHRRQSRWQCDGDTCTLAPHPPSIGSIQQKSGSDPQLSNRINYHLTNSNEYLTILAPTPNTPSKKGGKKPKPTPRSHKQVPESLPIHTGTFLTTPPTPPTGGQPGGLSNPSPHCEGLDVCVLLSSQRSLSESNLFSMTDLTNCLGDSDEDDDYVEMRPWQKTGHPLYVNTDETREEERGGGGGGGGGGGVTTDFLLPGDSGTVTLRRGMRRQISRSMVNLPAMTEAERQPLYENARACVASFLKNEQIYENGQHIMNYLLYGNVSTEREDEGQIVQGSHPKVAVEFGIHGDSGLGSTPSCSPLLNSSIRSFSLDNVRGAATANTLAREKMGCTNGAQGALGPTHNRRYANIPLITSS